MPGRGVASKRWGLDSRIVGVGDAKVGVGVESDPTVRVVLPPRPLGGDSVAAVHLKYRPLHDVARDKGKTERGRTLEDDAALDHGQFLGCSRGELLGGEDADVGGGAPRRPAVGRSVSNAVHGCRESNPGDGHAELATVEICSDVAVLAPGHAQAVPPVDEAPQIGAPACSNAVKVPTRIDHAEGLDGRVGVAPHDADGHAALLGRALGRREDVPHIGHARLTDARRGARHARQLYLVDLDPGPHGLLHRSNAEDADLLCSVQVHVGPRDGHVSEEEPRAVRVRWGHAVILVGGAGRDPPARAVTETEKVHLPCLDRLGRVHAHRDAIFVIRDNPLVLPDETVGAVVEQRSLPRRQSHPVDRVGVPVGPWPSHGLDRDGARLRLGRSHGAFEDRPHLLCGQRACPHGHVVNESREEPTVTGWVGPDTNACGDRRARRGGARAPEHPVDVVLDGRPSCV